MKAAPRFLALVFALIWLGRGGAASAQIPLYTANTTTAVPQSGSTHFLQIIKMAQGPGTYTINTIVFSANFTTGDVQTVRFYFYTGVDTSPTATDALAHATILSAQGGDLTPAGPGNFAFIYAPAPFTVTTDDAGNIAVEIILAGADGVRYSETANGRFTDSVPTVGTSSGNIWNDANLDSTFTGAEQTRFGMTNANVRLALTGVPFPVFKTFARGGTAATMTVNSFTGISYQLQRATSLTAGNWTNVGTAVAGANGTVLTFTDNDSTDPAAFYRVVAGPPTAPKGAAPKKSASGL